ncbi:MAG: hypothetical protein C4293_01560, partial [Nitrospiraceae bacterium]
MISLTSCRSPVASCPCFRSPAAVLLLWRNDPIDEEDVAFIIPGQTTFSEIIERLGAPDELAGVEDGKRAVIFYHFRDAKYSRVNFGWPLRFWTPVQPDFIFSGLGFGTDVFEVALNRDWVVQYHAFAKHV